MSLSCTTDWIYLNGQTVYASVRVLADDFVGSVMLTIVLDAESSLEGRASNSARINPPLSIIKPKRALEGSKTSPSSARAKKRKVVMFCLSEPLDSTPASPFESFEPLVKDTLEGIVAERFIEIVEETAEKIISIDTEKIVAEKKAEETTIPAQKVEVDTPKNLVDAPEVVILALSSIFDTTLYEDLSHHHLIELQRTLLKALGHTTAALSTFSEAQ